jgi:hypothetical protein
MQYILLLYAQEAGYPTLSDEEKAMWWSKINAYNEGLVRSGHFKYTAGLFPTHTATSLKVRNGKLQKVDGPYAETKEQLLGIYIIEAKDLDEAITLAAKAPMAEFGTIEVRPLNLDRANA